MANSASLHDVDDWITPSPDGADDWVSGKTPETPSGAATLLHGAERGALPAAGGWAGMAAGAKVGAVLGALIPGLGETGIGEAGGAIAGGLVGGFGGAAAVSGIQEKLLGMIPESIKEKIGQSTSQREAEELAHPYLAMAGELAPNLALLRPGAVTETARAGAGALERALSNPIGSRAIGAGFGAAQEAGTEYAQTGEIDPGKVAIATGAGALMNKETALGTKLRAGTESLIPFEPRRAAAKTPMESAAPVMAAGSVDEAIAAANQELSQPVDIEVPTPRPEPAARAETAAAPEKPGPEWVTLHDEAGAEIGLYNPKTEEIRMAGDGQEAQTPRAENSPEMQEKTPEIAENPANPARPEFQAEPAIPEPSTAPVAPEQGIPETPDQTPSLADTTKLQGRVRGAARLVTKGPVDAATFLAMNGGIRNDEAHDLIAGRGLQQFVPKVGPLIRKDGMSIDAAGEILHEAGYFGPPESTSRPTENEVLQFLEKMRRGDDGRPAKLYTHEDEAKLAQDRQAKAAYADNARALEEVQSHADDLGAELEPHEVDQVVSIMGDRGIDPESALVEYLERKAIQEQNDDHGQTGDTDYRHTDTDAGTAREVDSGPGEGGEGSPAVAGDTGLAGEARGAAAQDTGAQDQLATERGAAGLDQTIIPGAESSARQLAQAREEQGHGRIQPKANQKPADEGLFGEGEEPSLFARRSKKYTDEELASAVDQYRALRETDAALSKRAHELEEESRALVKTGPNDKHAEAVVKARAARKESNAHFDKIYEMAQKWGDRGIDLDAEIARPAGEKLFGDSEEPTLFQRREEDIAPPFFSALTRAVEGLKMEKAPPGQWEATIKNIPGLKAEELDWSGLNDWLRKQAKSVTKAEVLEHLRENEVRVQEVQKGGEGMRGFYDKILPAAVGKMVKKWGAKVEDATIGANLPSNIRRLEGQPVKTSAKVHSVAVTPAMRESVMKGQPLFKRAALAEKAPITTGQVRGVFTPEFDAVREQAMAFLRKRLNDLGLKDIALKLPDAIIAGGERVDGAYAKKIIAVALDALDRAGTLDHEAIHALRALGLFNKSEWSILRDKAVREWRKRYKIDERYTDFSEDKRNEEAIAEAFRYWRKGSGDQRGTIARIFNKVRNALEAVGNALRLRGFKTSEDIFRAIDTGEVGNRARHANNDEQTLFQFRDTENDGVPMRAVYIKSTGKVEFRPVEPKVAPATAASQPAAPRGTSLRPIEGAGAESKRAINGEIYHVGEEKPQMDAAARLVEKDPAMALAVAMRRRNPPEGLHPEFVYMALEAKAIKDGDLDMQYTLRKSKIAQEATTMGQRIAAWRNRGEISPVEDMRRVDEARTAKVQRNGQDPVKAVNDLVAQGQKQMRAAARSTKRPSWEEFISQISCSN